MAFQPGFLTTIVAILLVSRLFGEAAQRLGQPAVIGQLVAMHKERGELNLNPLKFNPEMERPSDGPLLFPGKVVADAVFLDAFCGRAATLPGQEQVHGPSAAIAGVPRTDTGNVSAVRKLDQSSAVVRLTNPECSHRSGSRPAAGFQAISADRSHTADYVVTPTFMPSFRRRPT